MPETPEQMLRCSGITPANLEKYGKQLLDVTIGFAAQKFILLNEAQEQNIEDPDSVFVVPPARKTRKTPAGAAGSSRAAAASNATVGSEDEWLTCEKVKAPAKKFSKKRKGGFKRKASFKRTGGNKSKVAKKSDYFGGSGGGRPYSPKVTTGASGSRRATGAGPSTSSTLGFMPLPKPVTKQFQF
jgi:hypothetical protein